MVQLLESQKSLEASALVASLSKELSQSGLERDAKGGIPEFEIERLRQTGLLKLTIPKEYGGLGVPWHKALKIVQELSKANASIGQLYGKHLNLTALAHVSGTPAQKERYYQETAQNNLFWGNTINTQNNQLRITPEGDHFRVNGVKSFSTSLAVADRRVFSAVQDGVNKPVLFVIPKDRGGLISQRDWDNIGQRHPHSGSFRFNNVFLSQDEILGPPDPPDNAFSTYLGIVAQLTKTHVYLGIIEAALEAVKQYTTTTTQPWPTSGIDRAVQDPYILHHYGDLWNQLTVAVSLAEQAAEKVQVAWEKEKSLTHEERGDVAIAVFEAQVFASKVGIKITSRIFDVMGVPCSTATKYGFDRYWRDLRNFTLHDLLDYKLKALKDWVVNQELPTFTLYS